jgi:hypothetical protein
MVLFCLVSGNIEVKVFLCTNSNYPFTVTTLLQRRETEGYCILRMKLNVKGMEFNVLRAEVRPEES